MTASYLAELELRLCPVCDGRPAVRGMCSRCDNTGILDQLGAPFEAPAPFDGWTPAALVRLSESSRKRTEGRNPVTDNTEERPRANVATLLRYQHEERLASVSKPGREDRPSFSAKRSTASSSAGLWELAVAVPVCEEYPTAEEAFQAQLDYMTRFSEAFPATHSAQVAP